MNPRNPPISFPIANANAIRTSESAQPEGDDAQSTSPKLGQRQLHLTKCTVHLSADFVASLGAADFLDGNKLRGTLRGFDHDYAKFTRNGSKDVIYIPKAAILYMSGEEPFFSY